MLASSYQVFLKMWLAILAINSYIVIDSQEYKDVSRVPIFVGAFMTEDKFKNDVLPMAEKYIKIPDAVPNVVEYLRNVSNYEYTFARLVDEETRLVAEMKVKMDDILSTVTHKHKFKTIPRYTNNTLLMNRINGDPILVDWKKKIAEQEEYLDSMKAVLSIIRENRFACQKILDHEVSVGHQ